MKCADGCRFYFDIDGRTFCDLQDKYLSDEIVGCSGGQSYDPDDLDEPIKRTNYDCVISKTPEELADWVWGAETAGRAYGPRGKKAWLDWLKQDAES